MKGVFEKKPALPRCKNTWDVNIVLKESETWIPTEKLALKELTYKPCMLMSMLVDRNRVHLPTRTFWSISKSKTQPQKIKIK